MSVSSLNTIRRPSAFQQSAGSALAIALHSASLFLVVALLAHRASRDSLGHYVLGYAIGAPVFMFLNARQRLVLVNHVATGDPTWPLVLTRLITAAVGAIGITAFAFTFWGVSQTEKALVVSLIGAVKASESVSDILYGGLQKAGALHSIFVALCTRALVSASATTVVVWATGSAVAAAFTLLIVWAGRAVLDLRKLQSVNPPRSTASISFLELLRSAFSTAMHPLALVAVLASFAYYVPRYFIGGIGGDVALGVFGALSYFGTILQMLGYAISDALMPGLAQRHRLALASRPYLADVHQLYAVLLAAGTIGVLALLLVGKPMLILLLGPSFSDGAPLTAGLLAAGTLMAVSSCQSHALVAFGMHRAQALAAVITFALLIAACAVLVPRWGMIGAVAADLIYAFAYLLALEWLLQKRIRTSWL